MWERICTLYSKGRFVHLQLINFCSHLTIYIKYQYVFLANDSVAMETSGHNPNEPDDQSQYPDEEDAESTDSKHSLSSNNQLCEAGKHSFRFEIYLFIF